MNIPDIPIAKVMTTEILAAKPSHKPVDVKHTFGKKIFCYYKSVAEKGKL